MGVVLANGIITATMNFKHDDNPREFFYEKYYYIEVFKINLSIYYLLCNAYNNNDLLTFSDRIYNISGFRGTNKDMVFGVKGLLQAFCPQI